MKRLSITMELLCETPQDAQAMQGRIFYALPGSGGLDFGVRARLVTAICRITNASETDETTTEEGPENE
jgi:hypothetical protein